MSLLTRDQILASTVLAFEEIEVPEWGGSVRVREMTIREQYAYNGMLRGADGKIDLADFEAKLITCTVCDETGALLFVPGDVQGLAALAAEPVGRVWEVAKRLNHLDRGALEEMGKALAAPSGASSSTSPPSSDEPSESSS